MNPSHLGQVSYRKTRKQTERKSVTTRSWLSLQASKLEAVSFARKRERDDGGRKKKNSKREREVKEPQEDGKKGESARRCFVSVPANLYDRRSHS